MAAMALQLRRKCTIPRSQGFIHRFSSSSNNGGEDNKDNQPPESPMSSYFSDVKASLNKSSTSPFRRLSQQSPIEQGSPSPSPGPSKPAKVATLEEIRKNLSEYRARSTTLPFDQKQQSSSPPKVVSFQDLYKRNVVNEGSNANTTAGSGNTGLSRFDKIRQSLKQIKNNAANQDQPGRGFEKRDSNVLNPFSLEQFKNSLKMKPSDQGGRPLSPVLGGSDRAPTPKKTIFRNEDAGGGAESEFRNDLLKAYSYTELGEKLSKLRPVETAKEKTGFSLKELNDRLVKLREFEEKASEVSIAGVTYADLRGTIMKLQDDKNEKSKKAERQRMEILGPGGTINTLNPPKEELVEKYFHPDNMSSAEKLQLELNKVRDEFKMSESDCGSSRVQVAQLTTKIKHLSSALHKKDKHSRKGLQEMVQRRKKLLKYLRRTDWDSYCLCLSKLGLRDNPDYKS